MARTLVSPSNRSPLVHIITWFFFFVSLFFLSVREITRRALLIRFKVEDGLIFAATAISIGQSIAVSASAANGLGKPLLSLSAASIQNVLKSQSAATTLLITCLGTTKLSIILFTKNLSPDASYQKYAYIIGLSMVVWMFIGIITSIFQCAPPRTWDYLTGTRCIDLDAWWTFIAIGNIVTDIAVVMLQAFLLWGLQIPGKSKAMLLAIFSFRFIVVGLAVAQLAVFRSTIDNEDATLTAWLPVVLNEILQSMGITTACITHVKRFLESLESGMIRVEEPEEQRGTELQDTGNSSQSGGNLKPNRSL